MCTRALLQAGSIWTARVAGRQPTAVSIPGVSHGPQSPEYRPSMVVTHQADRGASALLEASTHQSYQIPSVTMRGPRC